jgi:hypothetical protein
MTIYIHPPVQIDASGLASETTVGDILDDTGDILLALAAPVGAERVTIGTPYVRSYSSSNITDAAWSEIVAVTAGKIRKLHIFDSSGEQVRLALGPAGTEGEIWRIEPGGPGAVELTIAAGSRLSIRAASGTISDGDLVINFLS